MASSLHVSIAAETLFYIGPFPITNSMVTGTVVSILLALFAVFFSTKIKNQNKPSKLQNLVEMVIEAIFNLNKDIAGEKKARVFFPLIATAVIFILFNNWVSILPGVGTIGLNVPSEYNSHGKEESHATGTVTQAHAATEEEVLETNEGPVEGLLGEEHIETISHSEDGHSEEAHAEEGAHAGTTFIPIIRPSTADLNTTLALALISVGITQFYGVKYLGLSYFTKFFNFKQGPIFTFVGLLELISELAKIVSFAFRLFGNIFAGEVLLTVMLFLVPILIPIPFMGLELFVGLIQAIVFAMLTLVFINMATMGHDDH